LLLGKKEEEEKLKIKNFNIFENNIISIEGVKGHSSSRNSEVHNQLSKTQFTIPFFFKLFLYSTKRLRYRTYDFDN
jgi:hypothetical protein